MVCTGNICRSPMAAGLLRHRLPSHLKNHVEVTSAGTHALHGHQAQEHAVAAMARLGIDISGHRARQMTRQIAQDSDLVLTMEAAHLNEVRSLSAPADNTSHVIGEFVAANPVRDIEDPYGEPQAAYEACIQTLQPCIDGVVRWLEHKLSPEG